MNYKVIFVLIMLGQWQMRHYVVGTWRQGPASGSGPPGLTVSCCQPPVHGSSHTWA